MDILFLLVPISVLIVFGLMALFRWALGAGQFEDFEREGQRIVEVEGPNIEPYQTLDRRLP
ncbi:MAG TPA: cbb3-type cytochrome oxidase assembly protein CcoS [Burkholderiaceae bacterium]|nr:cbb3-type cytochrome oxidase assembly protein CcoS [Burkholderiaceae bacterium]